MRKIYENERCGCSTLEASYSCLLGGLLSLESFFCIYIYDKSLTNQPTFARNGPLATRSIENGMPHTDVFGSSPFECARDAMTPSSRIGDFWRMSINGSHGTWRPFDDARLVYLLFGSGALSFSIPILCDLSFGVSSNGQ